ncbi:PorP/SprF family type IX secretion system membrane protein [Chryseosolibacter histidini]|uniref:PorP/SprF family type IX secretion system membrane protein n=1 Tax=Chryseosolibacter histidini TaxID=2782349 RepID=UPI0021D47B1C|nr:PorP/SprF family type IX secretion system membrane protein [Chryseosolibacter histidini]
MRNCFYVLVLIHCLTHGRTIAQNYAVYNSYYLNPYLYNPAEVATEYSYLFVNHRQQWMGIEGAPELTTVSFNTMINESRAGIGVKASSFKRGLLTTSDFLFTYAYSVSLNQKSNMYFGLSGGAISNTIDISQADPMDPAIANYLANNMQPAANFGMVIKSATGLNFGVTLPQLFAPKFNSAGSFVNTTTSPLDNVVISTSFKRKVEGKIVSRRKRGVRAKVKTNDAYAPLEFYAFYKYSKAGNNQFEVMGKLNLSQNFWLGAAYRQSYGPTGSLGFSINRFLLSYSYEPGNQPEAAFSRGTHEMQLGLRIGKPKKYRREAPVLRSTIRVANEQHSARFQHKEEDPDDLRDQGAVKKKYYVVIRAFGDFTAADIYKKKLINEKYNANVFYNEADKKYYVHVFETTKAAEAHEETRNLKHYSKLREARVLIVTIKEE